MSETSIQHIILDLAVEDSYALSEIVSRVRQVDSNLVAKDAKELARRTVEELLEAGLIEVTMLGSPGGVESTLDYDAARVALADDLAWLELPHWRPHARIVATVTGKETYYRGH